MCPSTEVSGCSLRQFFLGSPGWQRGGKKGELGTQKLPGCPFPALGAATDPHSLACARRPGRSRGSCPAPLTKTPLPNRAWEPSVTVYTQLKIPTEKGSAQETWGNLGPWPPETLVLPQDPAGASGGQGQLLEQQAGSRGLGILRARDPGASLCGPPHARRARMDRRKGRTRPQGSL